MTQNKTKTTGDTNIQKQYTVIGTVIDTSTQGPISYATVSLTADSSSMPLSAAITDDAGLFTLPFKSGGAFLLNVSFAGYTTATQQITLNDITPNLNLGQIKLTPGLTADAVIVTAQRPLVIADIDKITYNASSDPESPTITAMEMMRKVPMLSVDGDDNLLLNGTGNFKILVNGKTSALMARNYKEVLKAMPAGSIRFDKWKH